MNILKCIVWDLDNTLWDGVILESSNVQLRAGVREAVTALDRAGVLQSVASRGDEATALGRLKQLGIAGYILHPQVAWTDKSESLRNIAEQLNIGLSSLVLIDDDPYERAQVSAALPEVRCFTPDDMRSLLAEAAGQASTGEARNRRQMYQAEQLRMAAEESSGLSSEAFARQLGLIFSVRRLQHEDLDRARELTVRTNQLNTTGITYDRAELDHLRNDPGHLLLAASLSDRFGDYGTIGLAVVRTQEQVWALRLALTSCRVVSRGAGSLLLGDVQRRAERAGVRLEAEMIPTERNRIMAIALAFAGFELQAHRPDGRQVFVSAGPAAAVPPHITVRSDA